ncbi:MAG: 2-polyprenyl-6-hydroxyphenyl methylase/3-demethylubiquinone-9 3-methyltransferase [Alphaproteobacteria bacterium]
MTDHQDEIAKGERFAFGGNWTIEEASVLDETYCRQLGEFDIVYSCGVQHHTGAMWRTLENIATVAKPGGKLWIAIYNDQGAASRRWLAVKKAYNAAPNILRWLVLMPEALFDFYKQRNFQLETVKTCSSGLGCNELVFSRRS